MSGFTVWVGWHGDDEDYVEVEAENFEDACRKAYEEWSVTGWTNISVFDNAPLGERAIWSSQLDRPFEDGTTWTPEGEP